MPNLLVQVPRKATASYMPAPVGVTCSWPSGQPLAAQVSGALITKLFCLLAPEETSLSRRCCIALNSGLKQRT
jgi:hypothetical protein